ncbi:hypothetical protein ACI2L1_45165, partial [Streptomyces sp. NPDC019531]|uniref:hypothetical protein n=1 Tax=Streptomyces sp. NPDC019531 TaxID=3365062 RepID=UPI00384EC9A1
WEQYSEEHEKGIGQVLAADPKVVQQARAAVGQLYTYLALRHGAVKARQAFFPEHQDPADAREAMRRLRDPGSDASLSELMTAFANAAYANPADEYTLSRLLSQRGDGARARWQRATRFITALPSTMRRWFSLRGWPIRMRTGAVIAARPESARGRDAAWLAQMRDRRGLRVGQSAAHSAAWLLQVHRWLNVPDGDALLFRQALMGWLLPSGEHSLFDVLEASHQAGTRDAAEPDLSGIDAAGLHGWADGNLDPRGLLGDPEVRKRVGAEVREALLESLTPPHQRMYVARTTWLTSDVTGEGAGTDAFSRMTGRPGGESLSGTVPPPFPPVRRESREALDDGLLRHDDVQVLHAETAYVFALHLVSGSDARLLDERFGDGVEGARLLRERAREVVEDAFAAAGRPSETDFRSSLPLLFLRDERFRELARQAEVLIGQTMPGGPGTQLPQLRHALTEHAEQLAGKLQEELGEHREMAAEALAMMAPVHSSVYWTSEAAHAPAEGARLILPRFHWATTRFDTARAQALVRGADARPAVWEAENATGRDISPFARVPGEGTVRYAAPVTVEVVAREERLDANGQPY